MPGWTLNTTLDGDFDIEAVVSMKVKTVRNVFIQELKLRGEPLT
ncbi:MAG: hypothetical protein ACR2HF_04015 [Methylococcaceae bacterium]